MSRGALLEKLLKSLQEQENIEKTGRAAAEKCLEVVEIGFGRGLTTGHLLKAFPCLRLNTVDIAFHQPEAVRLKARHRNQSVFWKMPSERAAPRFSREVDMVFVDGGHLYEDVVLDLRLWWPKIRSGGIMAGHDYNVRWWGVVKAVNEFASAKNLSLNLGMDFTFWFHVP